MSEHYLKRLFEPASIALIGASDREKTPGKILFDSLSDGYKGKLYLVNPHHKKIGDFDCLRSVADLPEGVDLAVVVTPARSVLKVMAALGKRGVFSALLITRGIGRVPREGRPSQAQLLEAARKANVRLMGPRAAGMIRTPLGLNATYAPKHREKGKLALVSDSSTMCAAVLDWAQYNSVTFSSVISYGMELDISVPDILDYLADDYHTRSIILHMESIPNARRFMSALRAAATRKPVVIMKSGHEAGSYSDAIARTTDTRSMDDVFHAAISRAGVVRVFTFSNLFAAAKTLSGNLRTPGTRIGIVANGRGPAMMATDRLRHLGKTPAPLSAELRARLSEFLHVSWSHENPVVLTDGCETERDLSETTRLMLSSNEYDAVMVIFAPDPRADPVKTAEAVAKVAKKFRKPVLNVWMGESGVAEARQYLAEKGLPNYRTPEAAADAFSFLCTYLRNQQLMLQLPYPLSKNIPPDIDSARRIVRGVLLQKKTVLSQVDSRLLLECFNIESALTWRATTPDEAVAIAEDIGYPVVLKIDSPNITYKSDVHGVRLNVRDEAQLRAEYEDMIACAARERPEADIEGVIVGQFYAPKNGRELMVRIINDPAFGSVISFGAGGTRSPALRDRAVQLPPLNLYLADDLISKTRVSMLIEKFRNMPAANRDLLRDVLMRVSEIACELPEVFELTINPLVLDDKRAVVTDANVVVRHVDKKARRYDHLAIHPYPSDWVRTLTLKNQRLVEVRPVRPEDARAEAEFVQNMSSQSRYFRFMHAVKELTPEMLSRFTKIDYDREMAFVAMTFEEGKEIMVGVSQYVINPDKQSCEFAIALADDWQGLGLARKLMLILMEHIRERDLKIIEGTVLRNNTAMDHLMASLGFVKSSCPDDPEVNLYRREVE
ncbi:bifunctional acetate--CoA ligase family protein/GNAT family N-acetyltransferase [Granulosicoccaceae sp. 1_MG-2023]|nr:bifunctional acetate--CoA ligase family protein/GNAT family N-acetyltransferase [Granulosicoccaceae sp. 1_MG-2023]